MEYKECTEWEKVELISATCPHCGNKHDYFACPILEGDILQCQNKQCEQKFVLGAEE